MSDHDPFDGIYDTPGSQPAADASPEQESRSEVTVVAPDDVDVSVVSEDETRHLSKTEITRMDKADLQAAVRERGLDDSGSRTELQERLREHQGD